MNIPALARALRDAAAALEAANDSAPPVPRVIQLQRPAQAGGPDEKAKPVGLLLKSVAAAEFLNVSATFLYEALRPMLGFPGQVVVPTTSGGVKRYRRTDLEKWGDSLGAVAPVEVSEV